MSIKKKERRGKKEEKIPGGNSRWEKQEKRSGRKEAGTEQMS